MGTYKHRFKLAYFYRVNIFHLVLSGNANQTYNFTNLVFFWPMTSSRLFSMGLERFNDASVSHHISSHIKILIIEKEIAILRQNKIVLYRRVSEITVFYTPTLRGIKIVNKRMRSCTVLCVHKVLQLVSHRGHCTGCKENHFYSLPFGQAEANTC